MSKIESVRKKLSKREARELVYDKLSGALAEFKDGVKEKKFRTNLKKASKLFAADIAKAVNKNGNARNTRQQVEKVPSDQVLAQQGDS